MPGSFDDLVTCDWCGQVTRLVWVAGHAQCGSCHRVLVECCNGETNAEGQVLPLPEEGPACGS